jgi:ADP-ribose pyrophosphatase YjhB (NUDIX family)
MSHDIIEIFRHCPRCGFAPLEVVERCARACSACGYRHYLNPVLAVGALIPDAQGRLLLIRRARPPAQGAWDMPGGFAEIGETAEDTLRREVREEVNLEIADMTYLTSFPNRYEYLSVIHHVTDLFFVARPVAWDALQELEDVDGHVFKRPEEIVPSTLAFDSLRHALRMYRSQGCPTFS